MKKGILAEQTFNQGAAVLLLSTVLVKIIGAFFKIPLSSDFCLGDLGFGYFASVYDIYVPIYTLAISGFPVAISKVISDYSCGDNKDRVHTALKLFMRMLFIIGIIGFVITILCIKPFVSVTDKSGKTAYTMLAMAPAMLFCCLSSVYRGTFEGYRNMTPTAISNVIEALSKVLFGFIGAFITVKLTNNLALGAAAAMLGITVGTVLSFIYLKITFGKFYKNSNCYAIDSNYEYNGIFKNMLLVCLPIVFTSLAGSIVSLIDAVSVKWLMSEMIESNSDALISSINGYFSALPEIESIPTFLYGLRSKAYTLFYLAPTFTSALSISALPMISAAFTSKKYQKARFDISSLIKFSSVISFPIAFGFIFAGTPVTALLYGDATSLAGGKILTIFGFAAASAGLSMSLATVLQGIGKQNVVFINFTVGLILKLLSNIILVSIPKLNIFGSAISTLICYCYVLTVLTFSLKKSGFLPEIKDTVLKSFFAALLCGITAFIICSFSANKLITVLAIFVAGVVYLTFLLMFKTFNKSDFEDLPLGNRLIKLLKLT